MDEITMQQFSAFSRELQCKVLYKHGVYVGKRKVHDKILTLYQLKSFYIEIMYDSYRQNIGLLHCSAKVNMLEPYLPQINVEELVNVVG